jgi:hypothetical protein
LNGCISLTCPGSEEEEESESLSPENPLQAKKNHFKIGSMTDAVYKM